MAEKTKMKWDIRGIDNWGWKKVPMGATIQEAGNAAYYRTGGWRTDRPALDKEKCTNCLICWINCPDSSIVVNDAKMEGFDYDHCKGCGICAKVCAPKAIEMQPERGEE